LVGILEGHRKKVTCLGMTASGTLVTGSSDSSLKVWDVPARSCLLTIPGHAGKLCPVTVWADRAAGEHATGVVRVWDTCTGEVLSHLEGHTAQLTCIDAEKGRVIATGSLDATVRLWSVAKGRLLHTLEGHTAAVQCVKLAGDRVASGGDDKSLRVWSVRFGSCLFVKRRHAAPVQCLHLVQEQAGSCLVSASEDGAVYVWGLEAEALVRTLLGVHTGRIRAVASARGLLVMGSVDKAGSVSAW